MIKKKDNISLNEVFNELGAINNCGLNTQEYTINKSYGKGSMFGHTFDGLQIQYFKGIFNDNFKFNNITNINVLELSFLIQGEKVIQSMQKNMDIVQEEQECIIYFSDNLNHVAKYYKNKDVKELRIKIFDDFVKKHQLKNLFPILNQYSRYLDKKHIYFSSNFCFRTQDILTDIITNSQKGILKRLFLESKVLELISLQIQHKKKKNTNESLMKKLHRVKNIISSSLNEQYSVKELSKKVLLNDTVLKKEFKRVFNSTISEFGLTERMNKASDLLLHTTKPIYEISDLVGYKNPTHFSAAFKKHTKLTPKQFRNAN